MDLDFKPVYISKNSTMNRFFYSLDLEMNQPENASYNGKIIQVGLVIGNIDQTIDQYEVHKWYVNPNEKIYPRITELTGITDRDILEKSSFINDIYDVFIDRVNYYNCFPNPVVWGNGDSNLLKQYFIDNVGQCRIFGHRDIDVKTIYTFFQIIKSRSTNSSLKSALSSMKLKFHGNPHRADDDALNTLSLFFEMIKRQKIINDSIQNLIKTI